MEGKEVTGIELYNETNIEVDEIIEFDDGVGMSKLVKRLRRIEKENKKRLTIRYEPFLFAINIIYILCYLYSLFYQFL